MVNGFVNVDGGKIYYEMDGNGPNLVLVHAGFVDSRMWDEQWVAFTENYRVIRFDMRGFGKSSVLEAPVSRRGDLYALLDHLDVKRAHLIGCSMGGEIVIDAALERPDLVTSLIVVSAVPSGFEMQGEPPPHMLEMFQAAQSGDIDLTSELQLRIWVDGMFRLPEQVNADVRQKAGVMNRIPVQNSTFMKADSQPVDPLDPPAIKRLNEIHVPMLILTGSLDHPEIGRAGDVMEGAIPGAQHVTIPNSAHVPNMEQPEFFNTAVLKFLSTHG